MQKPTVNHVTITVPDAIASNGVVHVIGDTLFPVPVGNVFDVLDNCTSLTKFRDYVLKAGLDTELKNPSKLFCFFMIDCWLIKTNNLYKFEFSFKDNPITLFAPTNDAFDLLPTRVKNILDSTNSPNSTGKKFNSIYDDVLLINIDK